jgi:hypothetical protein
MAMAGEYKKRPIHRPNELPFLFLFTHLSGDIIRLYNVPPP